MQACALLSIALALRLVTAGIVAELSANSPVIQPRRIDVNQARVSELMLLDGIGRRRAEQIVLHRVRHGWFERIEDLAAVDGIGPDTVRRLRAQLEPLPMTPGRQRRGPARRAR